MYPIGFMNLTCQTEWFLVLDLREINLDTDKEALQAEKSLSSYLIKKKQGWVVGPSD